jgi:hypothetical protein
LAAPNLDYSKDYGKTPVETACDEMVMAAVQALSGEFSPLVSQQNQSDLSHTALDDALKRLHKQE